MFNRKSRQSLSNHLLICRAASRTLQTEGVDAYQIAYASCKGYLGTGIGGRYYPYDPVVGDYKIPNTLIYGIVNRTDLERLYIHGFPAFESKIFSELSDLKQLNSLRPALKSSLSNQIGRAHV